MSAWEQYSRYRGHILIKMHAGRTVRWMCCISWDINGGNGTSDDSVSIDDEKMMSEEKLAIVLGTEGDGLADHRSQTVTIR